MDCTALVRMSPQSVDAFEADISDLMILVNASGNGNIVVNWSFLEQVESVQVRVTSECPTAVVPERTQVFTVTPNEGNSLNIMGLGDCMCVCV